MSNNLIQRILRIVSPGLVNTVQKGFGEKDTVVLFVCFLHRRRNKDRFAKWIDSTYTLCCMTQVWVCHQWIISILHLLCYGWQFYRSVWVLYQGKKRGLFLGREMCWESYPPHIPLDPLANYLESLERVSVRKDPCAQGSPLRPRHHSLPPVKTARTGVSFRLALLDPEEQ